MSQPSDHTGYNEQHCEEVTWEPQTTVNESAPEVDVGVQSARDKVVVLVGGFVQRNGRLQQRVVLARDCKHFLSGLTDDLRARIGGPVNPVPEAGQDSFFLLDLLQEFGNVFGRADSDEHLDNSFVRASLA